MPGGRSAVRPAAVAGRFYPDDPVRLRRMIQEFLGAATMSGITPKAIIVPHAGYVYSGPVAGSAYALLQPLRGPIRRVVLIGPAHRVLVRGLAVSDAESFATPLGNVPLDQSAIARLRSLPQVEVNDLPHAPEHSLEVHLPFLQVVLGEYQLVPLVIGEAYPEEVAQVLELLWDGPETLIVVSSDLSHFHDYQTARRMDAETARAIEDLNPDDLCGEAACGYKGIGGLLLIARRRGLKVRRLDLRNSGDTAGPREQVVGYGAWAVFDPHVATTDETLTDERRRQLLQVADRTIRTFVETGQPWQPNPEEYPTSLRSERATFVTLKIAGSLRGCMGSLEPRGPLVRNVAENAVSAATRDPRFEPVRREELDLLDISISVLNKPEPLRFTSEADLLRQIRVGVDGLTLIAGSRRATLLPAVWSYIDTPEEFLAHLKRKAGLPPEYPADELQMERYTTDAFGAPE